MSSQVYHQAFSIVLVAIVNFVSPSVAATECPCDSEDGCLVHCPTVAD